MVELVERLDAWELMHWEAMYRLGAFGSKVDDYRSGIVAAASINAGRLAAMAQGAKLRGHPASAADWFKSLTTPKPSKEQLRLKLLALAAHLGADTRGEKQSP